MTVDLIQESTQRRNDGARAQLREWASTFPQNPRWMIQIIDDHRGCICQEEGTEGMFRTKSVQFWWPESEAERSEQLYDDEGWTR